MAIALLGALFIGISLGLLGSGGSILTVPVLIFVLQRPEKLAIAESLAIVGSIALIGAIPYVLKAHVHWKSVFFFGLPGMIGAYIGACGSYYISGNFQLIFFAFIMLTVASIMIVGPPSFNQLSHYQHVIWLTIVEGLMVGCLTGFIGVGGGFLIVPSLVLLSQLPMVFAIGTSLVIIAMNSFTGFVEQMLTLRSLEMHVNWQIIAIISLIGIIGCFFGSLIVKNFSQIRLRQMFGFSMLILGSYIILKKF